MRLNREQPMKHFYFFRHGQTIENCNGTKYSKKDDSHLTKDGIKQSKELAEYLSDKKLDIIYSSPLNRALETAEIVTQKYNNLSIITNELLGESIFGFRTDNDIKTQEKINLTFSKIIKFLKEEAIECKFNNIAVSSHGSITRALCWATGYKADVIKNCQCFHFSFENNEWQFIEIFIPKI